jgi:hypothetical protein
MQPQFSKILVCWHCAEIVPFRMERFLWERNKGRNVVEEILIAAG